MNEIEKLKKKLKKIHPDIEEVIFIDGEVEVYFPGFGYPSIPSSFTWGSPTRIILEKMKDEFLKNTGV